MTTSELVNELKRHGATLTVRSDRLCIDAPAGVVTPELRATLVDRKQEILELLRGREQKDSDPRQPSQQDRGASLSAECSIFEVPDGWDRPAWISRLRHLASICINPRRKLELEEWASGLEKRRPQQR